jgi:hypothetical protein
MENNINPIEMHRGINKGKKAVLEFLDEMAF